MHVVHAVDSALSVYKHLTLQCLEQTVPATAGDRVWARGGSTSTVLRWCQAQPAGLDACLSFSSTRDGRPTIWDRATILHRSAGIGGPVSECP